MKMSACCRCDTKLYIQVSPTAMLVPSEDTYTSISPMNAASICVLIRLPSSDSPLAWLINTLIGCMAPHPVPSTSSRPAQDQTSPPAIAPTRLEIDRRTQGTIATHRAAVSGLTTRECPV